MRCITLYFLVFRTGSNQNVATPGRRERGPVLTMSRVREYIGPGVVLQDGTNSETFIADNGIEVTARISWPWLTEPCTFGRWSRARDGTLTADRAVVSRQRACGP